MVGEHVTLGGEADAETELDVSEARDKSSTTKAGTGLVHTAPGHGHDDFVIGKKYGLEIYCPVDNAGRFASDVEHFAGMTVFEANPKIVDFMREQGVLLFSENYDHRYPHCWRCKNPVIFRATPQWFISMDEGGQSIEGEEDRGSSPTVREGSQPNENSLRVMALREVDDRVRWIPAWGRRAHAQHAQRQTRLVRFAAACLGRADSRVSTVRSVSTSSPKQTSSGTSPTSSKKKLPTPGTSAKLPNCFPKASTCEECGATEFTKETDILDVWFDSGRLPSRFWRSVKICVGRPMFTSKVAISFAAGSIHP